MATSALELKRQAEEIDDRELQHEVSKAIDSEFEAMPEPMLRPRPGAKPMSLATLYLADRFYASLPTGAFTGRPTVRWDGFDNFEYVAAEGLSFSYQTATNRSVQPLAMSTDGGSIPLILRGFRKFSPWGYGPAFVVHDWLFVAHREGLAPDTDWTLESAARLMAECMKTLMEVGYRNSAGETARLAKAEDTLYLMYLAVVSPVARRLWERPPAT